MLETTATDCGRLRVACVGDSLTRGDALHEHPPAHRVPSAKMKKRNPHQFSIRQRGSYPALLARLLPSADVRNFGHGGATACHGGNLPYHQMREYQPALRFKPHLVLLMLGTNDAKGRIWRGSCSAPSVNLAAGLHGIVDAFFGAPSPPRLLLLLQPPTMLAPRVFEIERTLLADVRRTVDTVAQHHRRAGRPVALAPPLPTAHLDERFFTADKLHLNANGSAVLACAAHDALRFAARPSLQRMTREAAGLARGVPPPSECAVPPARSCWAPFCADDDAKALDDASTRECDADSGALAPYVLTGWPCVGGLAAARGACKVVRRQFDRRSGDDERDAAVAQGWRLLRRRGSA